MPAVSKSQFREMFILRKQGKISEKQLRDFTAEENVNYKKLPEKVRKPKEKGHAK